MKEKPDKETGKILEQGEKLALFVQSEEWQNIKNILFKRLGSISSFDEEELNKKTDEEIGKEMKVRQKVIQVVIDWIDQIEGIPGQHQANLEAFKKGRVDDIIIRLGE
jgi:hypothetical protein